MKKYFFFLAFSLLLFAGCRKDKEKQVDIEELTSCPLEVTCTYSVYNGTNYNRYLGLFPDRNFRTFSYRITNSDLCASATEIFAVIPRDKNEFFLGKKEIDEGRIVHESFCTCCFSIALKVVGGYLKGINLNSKLPESEARWLVEAELILLDGSGSFRDTVYLKQVFTPATRGDF
jgi:hypothetical protein